MDMIFGRKNYCYGCLTFDKKLRLCNGYFNSEGSCPCSECLVKSMCDDGCSSFGKFTETISNCRSKGYSDKEIMEILKNEKQTNSM